MNYNHLPAGRFDGGQFTFATVGGNMPGLHSGPVGRRNPYDPVDPEMMATDPSQISDETANAMRRGLAGVGVGDKELLDGFKRKYGSVKGHTPDEFRSLLKGLIRDTYFGVGVRGGVEASLRTGVGRHQELVNAGGQVKALGNDDGSWQAVHTTNNSVAVYLDSLEEIKSGQAVAYNPKTGVLRSDGYVIPIPGASRTIGANSTRQSKRNRLNAEATNGQRNAKRASDIVNDMITDSSSASSRQIGNGKFAGRVGVSIMEDENGNLIAQNCVICETNEADIAAMYAEKLGSEVQRVNRPASVVNPEPGDTGMLHEGGVAISESDFGGVAAGVDKDTGYRSQVSGEDAKRAFELHDQLRKQRDEEYKAAHDGQPRPEKSDEKRQHEALLRKQRRMRKDEAEAQQAAGEDPIRLKGGGYIFKGETIERGGQKFTYDDIKSGAELPSGVGKGRAKSQASSAAGEAMEAEKKRQATKVGNRSRKQQQRAREAAIREANSKGLDAITYREGKDKASGKTVLVVQGDPGYEEAKGYKTAKVHKAK